MSDSKDFDVPTLSSQSLEYEEVPTILSDSDLDSDTNDGAGDDNGEDQEILSTLRELKRRQLSVSTSQFSVGPNGEIQPKSLQSSNSQSSTAHSQSQSQSRSALPTAPITLSRPLSIADFFRNFLTKTGMTRTLEAFQSEWFEKEKHGELPLDSSSVYDIPQEFLHSHAKDVEIAQLKAELKNAELVAEKSRGNWIKLKKERDFHRLHHRRVVQEKNQLIEDLKRMKRFIDTMEPQLLTMRGKYEAAMKEKMLVKLEKDKMKMRVEQLENQLKLNGKDVNGGGNDGMKREEKESRDNTTRLNKSGSIKINMKKPGKSATLNSSGSGGNVIPDTPYPEARENPYLAATYTNPSQSHLTLDFTSIRHRKAIKAHTYPISSLAIHPTKNTIIATGSDDTTWKLWSISSGSGDLLLSGEGHKEWISGLAFHYTGNMLVSASGDGTLKLWDLASASCKSTIAAHSQAIWSVSTHPYGDFALTGSLDHTAKLWDFNTEKCRQSFRGHVDSVNCAVFQPYSEGIIATASGDKTVSVWDCRASSGSSTTGPKTALCVQTFYGHSNAVLSCQFNYQANSIVSSDADGVIKRWDLRNLTEAISIQKSTNISAVNPAHPVNCVEFDLSGRYFIAGSDDSMIRVYNSETGELVNELNGQEGAVQALRVDPQGGFIVSAGADGAMRMWA